MNIGTGSPGVFLCHTNYHGRWLWWLESLHLLVLNFGASWIHWENQVVVPAKRKPLTKHTALHFTKVVDQKDLIIWSWLWANVKLECPYVGVQEFWRHTHIQSIHDDPFIHVSFHQVLSPSFWTSCADLLEAPRPKLKVEIGGRHLTPWPVPWTSFPWCCWR